MDPLHTQEKNSIFEVCMLNKKNLYIQQNLKKKPRYTLLKYIV